MAIEAGQDYNPESAKDLRTERFHFHAHGTDFRFALEIPEYVLRRINRAEVRNELQEYMDGYCSRVVVEAMRGGYLLTPSGQENMGTNVQLHAREYIWERFSISQEHAGNDCWEVAPSLQNVRKF